MTHRRSRRGRNELQSRRHKRMRRMTKDDDNDIGDNRLPTEIIHDILTRVPIKNFICVCKQWADLIKDPLFIDLHSRRNYNPTGIIFNPPRSKSRLVLFDINKKTKRTIWNSQDDIAIVGIFSSLNGVLLLQCYDLIKRNKRNYRVLNPRTQCSMILPELFIPREFEDPISDKRNFSLAYDFITAKYKVVWLGENYPDDKQCLLCKIFTIDPIDEEGKYSWRDVVVPKLPHNHSIVLKPVFANGCLHWMMCDERESVGIFCLDVSKETFYTIRIPKHEGQVASLHEMDGLLCFVDHITLRSKFKLWVLKEEGDYNNKRHQWMKKCDIDMEHLEEEESGLSFRGFLTYSEHLFAVLAEPQSIKLIFWKTNGDDSDMGLYYPYAYYSYDTKNKKFEFICEQSGVLERHDCNWHVNKLAYF